MAELPDPFETRRLVDEMVSYPRDNHHNITLEVDDSPRTKRVLRALSDATNVFAYEGTMYSPSGLWDHNNWIPLFQGINLSEEDKQAVKTSLEQKEMPIDALLKVATPASLGRHGEAVFDPEYRKAFEIPRSRLPKELLEVLEGCTRISGLEAMKPLSKKWSFQLYKIHMYGPGGKFEDHVDTLHQSNHVATVVLPLPSKHVGGTLRVRHHGETMEFDSSKGPQKSRYGHFMELCYAAFFTDCTHSVQEVVSGWRVVVQYDLYEEDVVFKDESDGDQDSDDDDKARAGQVMNCLECNTAVGTSMLRNKEQAELVQAVSQYLKKIPPTQGVAFFLRHRYSLPALNENVLKGADRTIFDAFSKRKDLAVSVQGVLVYIETEDMEHVSVDVTAVSMKDFLPDDDESSIATGENRKRKESVTSEEITVRLIVDSKNGAMCVHETGETGNEPADGYTSYFVACMIVRSVENKKPAAAKK